MMSRKHFEIVAAAMLATMPDPEGTSYGMALPAREFNAAQAQWCKAVDELAAAFQRLNSRFDPLRFRTACGYYGRGKVKGANGKAAGTRTAFLTVGPMQTIAELDASA